MKYKHIQEAQQEALRFLSRYKDLEGIFRGHSQEFANRILFQGCSETAALKRASLDLSRALAKMRK